jgi:hypothetical protein
MELLVFLPRDKYMPPLIGIPLSLPMGWASTPPYFCAFTETSTDVASSRIIYVPHLPPHPLEQAVQTLPMPTHMAFAPHIFLPWQSCPPSMPLQYVNMCIDDFSLCFSGAMALLCAGIDPDKIQLLHVQAHPIIASLAAQILRRGHFALIPNNRLL